MKHKVGDKVVIAKHESINCGSGTCMTFIKEMHPYVGKIATIKATNGFSYSIDLDGGRWLWSDCMFTNSKPEREVKPMKRRFKLLKETPDVKKGAIYEEACEDGTQPYILITPEYDKFPPREGARQYSMRDVVEKNSEWFEEVFPVSLTKTEHAKFKEWMKKGKRK